MARAMTRDDLASGKLLTVDEAAMRLGIGRSHAYEFILRGEIRSVKIGRSRRIRSCSTPQRIS